MLHPGQPWLWREDWAQGYAQAEWQSTATVMTVIGVAFLLFSVPMLVNLPAELWKQHPFQIALVLFFPVAGIYLTGQSLLAYLRARKFKKMRLCFSSVPCVIGGKLQGQMETDFVFPPGATVDLKLSCVRSYVSGSGENRTRWERILWQDPKSIAVSTDGYTSYAPIEFTIPFDANPPMKASGLRIGTPSVSTRGMREAEMREVGNLIADVLEGAGRSGVSEGAQEKVRDLCRRFPFYGGQPLRGSQSLPGAGTRG